MLRRMTVTVGVVAVAGGLAFGGVVGARVATKPMSEKQWRKTTNRICRQTEALAGEASNQAFAGVGPDEQPSIEQLAAWVALIEPVVQQRIDSIDALKEPTALKKKVNKLLKTTRSELAALVADPSRGLEGNPLSGAALASNKLGLKDCA